MKKKFLVSMLALVVGLPCSLTLAACGEKENVDTSTILNSNMISLEYNYTMYNGLAKEPEVVIEVNESVVADSEYSVQYANNINAGVADVVVTANEGSKILSGNASTNFTIGAARINVATYDDLKSALQNANYSSISLKDNITIPAGETLVVTEGRTINCGDYVIINNGTIENHGKIKVDVNTKVAFEDAMQYASHIQLTNNIEMPASERINIDAEVLGKNVNLDIDLNGYSITGYIRVCGKEYQANVNIKDYKQKSSIGAENSDYGIISIGGNSYISLYGVKVKAYYAALATNGLYEGGSISATLCKFTAYSAELGNNSGLAAYLPAKSAYSFTGCEFTGSSAYYAKSGTHSLTNCTFNGTQSTYETPKHYGSGGNATGSALIIDSSMGYKTPLMLTVYNGKFTSVAGYGIEEYCSGNVEDYSTTNFYGELTYTTEKENHKIWESPVA